jgi:hypothetical protein
MSGLVDFNISTPRNRTQSRNECGVVINNNVANCLPKFSQLPPFTPSPVIAPYQEIPSVLPNVSIPEIQTRDVKIEVDEQVRYEKELYYELALTFSKILKDNNKKLLANLIDQSGKIIVDRESLCVIISKLLNIPVDFVHIEYMIPTSGCLAKALKIGDIQDIKINHIDFRLGYNEKYNILRDVFSISLVRVMI